MTALPTFKYSPDPVAGGSIEPSEVSCAACGRSRGFISNSLLYAEHAPDEARFCPWCIADASATARFGGTFNELQAGAPEDVRAEVEQRTPNFETWQDWDWPVHCEDACVYLGSPPGRQLRDHPGAEESIAAELRSLDPNGSAVGYLFRCQHCGTHVAVWDSD